MTNKRLHKTLLIRDGQMDGNKLSGDAAGIGNFDCYGDVIFPGFFSDCLGGFLASGFVADNHDWTKQLAMPTAAEERGTALYTEAEFHSTQDAQDARTKVQERMERGLSVGLSIGFDMEGTGFKAFKNGADLIAYAKANGYDMTLFDVKGISAHAGRCQGLLKCHELFEYSLATVPANRAATASSLKAARQILGHNPPEIVTLSGASGVRLKGEYLGDDIESELTMSALDRLMSRLFYRAMYQNIVGTYEYDYDEDEYSRTRPPLAEALVAIEGAIDEFKEIVLRVVEAIMSGADGAETVEDAADAIKSLWGDPLTKSFPDGARPPASSGGDLTSLLTALKTLGAGQFVALGAGETPAPGLWTKDGRVLSEANRDKLAAHKDSLAEGITMLEDLLAASEPKAAPDAAGLRAVIGVRADALRHQLRARRAPVSLTAAAGTAHSLEGEGNAQ